MYSLSAQLSCCLVERISCLLSLSVQLPELQLIPFSWVVRASFSFSVVEIKQKFVKFCSFSQSGEIWQPTSLYYPFPIDKFKKLPSRFLDYTKI